DYDRFFRRECCFTTSAKGGVQSAYSYAEFCYLAKYNRGFSSLIAASFPLRVAASLPLDASTAPATTAALGSPERATVQLVSANYFSELAVGMALGLAVRSPAH